jgi:hypothetical protein
LVLVVVCGLAAMATVAPASLVQTNTNLTGDTDGFSMPAGTNLILSGSSAVSTRINYAPPTGSGAGKCSIGTTGFGNLNTLTDGTIAKVKPTANTQVVLTDGADGVNADLAYQVFVLDTASAPLGYDVSRIDAFSSWSANAGATLATNNARAWENIEVRYNLVGETYSGSGELMHTLAGTAPFRLIQPVAYTAYDLSLTDDTGTLLSGISAIEIKYLSNGQKGSGLQDPVVLGTRNNLGAYSEVVAIGSPTVPEPSSLVILVSAFLGLVAYAWRKRR